VHFASEQLLMRLYNYPHIQQHQADYDDAVERLDAVRATYFAPDAQLALDAVDELSDWIVGHIYSADHKLGHFLVRLGVGPG
jgi:hemerythrin-like metal-binding protein